MTCVCVISFVERSTIVFALFRVIPFSLIVAPATRHVSSKVCFGSSPAWHTRSTKCNRAVLSLCLKGRSILVCVWGERVDGESGGGCKSEAGGFAFGAMPLVLVSGKPFSIHNG